MLIANVFELDREVHTASRDQVRQPINRVGLGRWREHEAEFGPLTDVIHPEHGQPLSEIRVRCDRLIVALNTDAPVYWQEGPT